MIYLQVALTASSLSGLPTGNLTTSDSILKAARILSVISVLNFRLIPAGTRYRRRARIHSPSIGL